MGFPAVGAVVLIDFPFADLKGYKKRPAVVVAQGSLATVIICQITSRQVPNAPSLSITKSDFSTGGLPLDSFIRPDKLLSVDARLAGQNQLGQLKQTTVINIRQVLQELFTGSA